MSTAKIDTLQNRLGTKSVPVNTVVDGSAKAWVNLTASGVQTIRKSFNVSSVVDVGAGQSQINFLTAMADANFATTIGITLTGGDIPQLAAQTNTSVTISTITSVGGNGSDSNRVCVSVFS